MGELKEKKAVGLEYAPKFFGLKELKFKTLLDAERKVKEVNKIYGYKPEIYKLNYNDKNKIYFAISLPNFFTNEFERIMEGDKLK
tara:strand:+ start:518 stop:772 length:255 start_codon:yes stop_codon:yes gene_type:complete